MEGRPEKTLRHEVSTTIIKRAEIEANREIGKRATLYVIRIVITIDPVAGKALENHVNVEIARVTAHANTEIVVIGIMIETLGNEEEIVIGIVGDGTTGTESESGPGHLQGEGQGHHHVGQGHHFRGHLVRSRNHQHRPHQCQIFHPLFPV